MTAETERKPVRWHAQHKWNRANPVALWSHQCVRSALKRGIIERQPCAMCGSPDAEFHHPDHRRPLDGEWLCRLHHRREHVRLKCEAAR